MIAGEQVSINLGLYFEGQDPWSASEVEQTYKLLRASVLLRGWENLRVGCGKLGNLSATPDDDSAKRKKT